MREAQEGGLGVGRLEIPRFFGRRSEAAHVTTSPESALLTAERPDPDVCAQKKDAVEFPRIWLVLGLATMLAAPVAILGSLAGVWWWDDEGTLMAGFRSLLDGHRMYDEIYSLYGPLYNLVYAFIYVVLRVPLTHDAGRLLCAVLWLAESAGFAVFVWKLTRSKPAALFTYAIVLVWLIPLSRSPGHPAQLCLLLLTAVLLLVSSIERASSSAAWGALGATVAGLALVKINIGAYVAAPVLYVLLRASPANSWTKHAARVLAAAMLSMPFAVEAILFDFDWVRTYCIFSTLTVLAALIVSAPPARPADVRSKDWTAFVLAGGLTGLAIFVSMMLAGSSPYAIFNAVLLQNVEWIRNWWRPLDIPWYGVVAAVASVGAALLYRIAAARPELEGLREFGLLVLRWTYLTAAASALVFHDPMIEFSIVVPFFWLIMSPPSEVRKSCDMARKTAGLIAALMSLYAFPVQGTQDYVATLLPVALATVIAYDALVELHRRDNFGCANASVATRSVFVALLMVCLWPAAAVMLGSFVLVRAYFVGVPLGLPGAEWVRVDQEEAADLRWVTAQLSSCAASYSVPGMLSFAFWTGQPLATTVNVNDVLGLISPARQEGIVRDLSRLPGLCILYNPTVLERFDRGQIATDPPLLHYLRSDFVPKAQRHDYVILVRKDAVKTNQAAGPPLMDGSGNEVGADPLLSNSRPLDEQR